MICFAFTQNDLQIDSSTTLCVRCNRIFSFRILPVGVWVQYQVGQTCFCAADLELSYSPMVSPWWASHRFCDVKPLKFCKTITLWAIDAWCLVNRGGGYHQTWGRYAQRDLLVAAASLSKIMTLMIKMIRTSCLSLPPSVMMKTTTTPKIKLLAKF